MRLVIPSDILIRLRTSLFQDEKEACAIIIGKAVLVEGELKRLIAAELVELGESDYDNRTSAAVQINSELIAVLSQRVRKTGESIVFVHTHPFAFNSFSKTDDEGEKILAEFFKRRTPETLHASLLITPETMLARILGQDTYLNISVIGRELSYYSRNIPVISNRFDRQLRVFGREGQQILECLKVAIVGLGGTGSIVAQQLAYLGVKDFLLIDPDYLEETNLNRVVGANRADIGSSKVDIAQRATNRINSEANVKIIRDSILKNSIARLLVDTDFTFCCTDSHGSRAVLNQLAYQYLVPMIDMGVVISASGSKIERIAARTQLLAPGIACMVCGNLLDYEEVRRDLLTDFERKNDPYILNHAEPAPAVISLNSTIASLAITMFLNFATGVPGSARLINYNGITSTTRAAVIAQHPTCIVCSKTGSFARGDTWELPGRRN
jgi:molybdopterin-synthase adenylyltransferase